MCPGPPAEAPEEEEDPYQVDPAGVGGGDGAWKVSRTLGG